jgi:hypothetical protein
MRKRIVAAMSAAVVVGGLAIAGTAAEATSCTAGGTSPCDVSVQAIVGPSGLTGTRTLGAVAPIGLVAGATTLSGALAVPVVETVATGDNAWSVTAVASNLTNGSGGTITADHLTVADSGLPTGVGCILLTQCTVTGGGGARALDAAKTLFSVTGENTAAAYTGVYAYTGTLSLSVPNGTPLGTYNGSLTLTLLQ